MGRSADAGLLPHDHPAHSTQTIQVDGYMDRLLASQRNEMDTITTKLRPRVVLVISALLTLFVTAAPWMRFG